MSIPSPSSAATNASGENVTIEADVDIPSSSASTTTAGLAGKPADIALSSLPLVSERWTRLAPRSNAPHTPVDAEDIDEAAENSEMARLALLLADEIAALQAVYAPAAQVPVLASAPSVQTPEDHVPLPAPATVPAPASAPAPAPATGVVADPASTAGICADSAELPVAPSQAGAAAGITSAAAAAGEGASLSFAERRRRAKAAAAAATAAVATAAPVSTFTSAKSTAPTSGAGAEAGARTQVGSDTGKGEGQGAIVMSEAANLSVAAGTRNKITLVRLSHTCCPIQPFALPLFSHFSVSNTPIALSSAPCQRHGRSSVGPARWRTL